MEKAKNSNDKFVKRMFGLATSCFDNKEQLKSKFAAFMAHLENMNTLFDNTINEFSIYAFNAEASSNNVYTLKEMLKHKDMKHFVNLMTKEVQDHEDQDH